MDYFEMLSALELSLIGIAAATFIVQVLYYRITYLRPCRMAQSNDSSAGCAQPPLSVVIYSNNESANLRENLPLWLGQDYPQYEVIVINDGSTDESDDVLKLFENEYPNLYHTFIPQESRYLSRRKLSLTIGIKAAKHDILLFTEAACRPLSDRWLASMARNYTGKTDITLGFCAYRTHKGFFHKLVAYDNLLSGVQAISATLARRPYSGDGRNLSYRKALFYEHKGYSHSLGLHAGDDDLFVNEFATGENTRVEYSGDSITSVAPFDCFEAWREMKVSRAATRRYFKGDRTAFYRAERYSSAAFILSAVALILVGALAGNPVTVAAGFTLYFFLYVIKAVTLERLSALLQQHPSTAMLPLLEMAALFAGLYVGVYRLFDRRRAYTFTIGGK
ncbi:MAG: glycosyltransferase [Tannerellaceae bacterium]|jgi:glycosyltransferase involved in cell wall biosynthesis|nr:glycosyltransferase [Tannerellaceae bacterium]